MLIVAVIALALVAAAVVWGRSQTARSYISFPCRVCGRTTQVAVAETVRRLTEAQKAGRLGALGELSMPCMKCGTNQAPDWLLHPRTKQLLAQMDEHTFRQQTAAEYMQIVGADASGARAAEPPQGQPAAGDPRGRTR